MMTDETKTTLLAAIADVTSKVGIPSVIVAAMLYGAWLLISPMFQYTLDAQKSQNEFIQSTMLKQVEKTNETLALLTIEITESNETRRSLTQEIKNSTEVKRELTDALRAHKELTTSKRQ